MSIVVETPGLFDTIQDAGRPGHRAYGVPLGGWFDAESAAYANALVGNDRRAPCLEITLRSGQYRVLSPVRVGIAGPGAIVTIDRRTGPEWTCSESIAADLEPGHTFRIHHPARGLRSYVAAAGGGWSGDAILGSFSSEVRLESGHVIACGSPAMSDPHRLTTRSLGFELAEAANGVVELAFVSGGEFRTLADTAAAFEPTNWRMSVRSDRVGTRFELTDDRPRWVMKMEASRLSAPVVPGTMQWTGSELIVLGVAGGTMGGYPVFGQLVQCEIARLAQLRPGCLVRFRCVSLEEAWAMNESRDLKLSRNLTFVRLSSQVRLPVAGDFAID